MFGELRRLPPAAGVTRGICLLEDVEAFVVEGRGVDDMRGEEVSTVGDMAAGRS